MGHKPTAKYTLPEFDPRTFNKDVPMLEPEGTELDSQEQEVSEIYQGRVGDFSLSRHS